MFRYHRLAKMPKTTRVAVQVLWLNVTSVVHIFLFPFLRIFLNVF